MQCIANLLRLEAKAASNEMHLVCLMLYGDYVYVDVCLLDEWSINHVDKLENVLFRLRFSAWRELGLIIDTCFVFCFK